MMYLLFCYFISFIVIQIIMSHKEVYEDGFDDMLDNMNGDDFLDDFLGIPQYQLTKPYEQMDVATNSSSYPSVIKSNQRYSPG